MHCNDSFKGKSTLEAWPDRVALLTSKDDAPLGGNVLEKLKDTHIGVHILENNCQTL